MRRRRFLGLDGGSSGFRRGDALGRGLGSVRRLGIVELAHHEHHLPGHILAGAIAAAHDLSGGALLQNR